MDFIDDLKIEALLKGLPVLHGDGTTDDSKAIQAMIDGKPVLNLMGKGTVIEKKGNVVQFPRGTYSLSTPMIIK